MAKDEPLPEVIPRVVRRSFDGEPVIAKTVEYRASPIPKLLAVIIAVLTLFSAYQIYDTNRDRERDIAAQAQGDLTLQGLIECERIRIRNLLVEILNVPGNRVAQDAILREFIAESTDSMGCASDLLPPLDTPPMTPTPSPSPSPSEAPMEGGGDAPESLGPPAPGVTVVVPGPTVTRDRPVPGPTVTRMIPSRPPVTDRPTLGPPAPTRPPPLLAPSVCLLTLCILE